MRTAPADAVAMLVFRLSAADAKLAEVIVEGLAEWPKDRVPPAVSGDLEAALVQLAPRLSTGPRGALVRLAERWRSTALEVSAAR